MIKKALAAGAIASATVAGAQSGVASPQESPIHVIVNVDLMPDQAAAGAGLLSAHVVEARHAKGVLSVQLIQQVGASNHYILDARFANKAAYAHFVQSAEVRAFRTALHPCLGSPWDARLGRDVEPSNP